MAQGIYFAGLAIIALVLIMGGLADAALWYASKRTITDFLRGHPYWFLVPASLMLLFLVGLSLHLFGRYWKGV